MQLRKLIVSVFLSSLLFVVCFSQSKHVFDRHFDVRSFTHHCRHYCMLVIQFHTHTLVCIHTLRDERRWCTRRNAFICTMKRKYVKNVVLCLETHKINWLESEIRMFYLHSRLCQNTGVFLKMFAKFFWIFIRSI